MDNTSVIHIIVHGSAGRMGSAVTSIAGETSDFELAAGVRRLEQYSDADRAKLASLQPDVVLDFTLDPGPLAGLELAQESGCALLVGTTGMSRQTTEKIVLASKSLPVLLAPNTSIMVAQMRQLVTTAAAFFGIDAKVSIEETHQSTKRDAPSGTALDLAAAINAVNPKSQVQDHIKSNRIEGASPSHEISFETPEEIFKIFHNARSNRAYALGALAAARWIVGRSPGCYSMADVVTSPPIRSLHGDI